MPAVDQKLNLEIVFRGFWDDLFDEKLSEHRAFRVLKQLRQRCDEHDVSMDQLYEHWQAKRKAEGLKC